MSQLVGQPGERRGGRREEEGVGGERGEKREGRDEVMPTRYSICMSPVHETCSSMRDSQEGCD